MNELPQVRHWLICTRAEPEDPGAAGGPLRLHGVTPRYALPAGTVYPATDDTTDIPGIARLDVLARFDGGSGRTDFEIQVYWLDAPDEPWLLETAGPYLFEFDGTVRDARFELFDISAYGLGEYAVQLVALPGVESGGRPNPEDDTTVLGVDYFTLVEATL